MSRHWTRPSEECPFPPHVIPTPFLWQPLSLPFVLSQPHTILTPFEASPTYPPSCPNIRAHSLTSISLKSPKLYLMAMSRCWASDIWRQCPIPPSPHPNTIGSALSPFSSASSKYLLKCHPPPPTPHLRPQHTVSPPSACWRNPHSYTWWPCPGAGHQASAKSSRRTPAWPGAASPCLLPPPPRQSGDAETENGNSRGSLLAASSMDP